MLQFVSETAFSSFILQREVFINLCHISFQQQKIYLYCREILYVLCLSLSFSQELQWVTSCYWFNFTIFKDPVKLNRLMNKLNIIPLSYPSLNFLLNMQLAKFSFLFFISFQLCILFIRERVRGPLESAFKKSL